MIRKLKKGFTLVELVVVIAVIAILAAVSIVSYMGITKKAKESNDHMMIDQINLSVASTSIPNRKATVHEMLEDLKENAGFGVEKIKPELEGTEFVYSYSMNKFAYWKNNDVVYPEDVKNNSSARGTDLWFFVDLDSNGVLAKGHSYYLKSSQSEEVMTDGGLDVGGCTTISSINFTRTTKAATDVVIRTNSASTNIVLNPYVDSTDSTKGDHIELYGSVGQVTGPEDGNGNYNGFTVAFNSLKVNGKVVALKAASGHIDLTNAVAEEDEEIIILATTTDVKVSNPNNVPTHAHATSESNANSMNDPADTTKKSVGVTWDYDGNVAQNAIDDIHHHITEEQAAEAGDSMGTGPVDGGENWVYEEVVETAIEEAVNKEEVEKAEEAGYVVTHHEAKAPTCTEVGYYAYDSYEVNGEVVKIGYKEIPAIGHEKSNNPSYQHAFSATHWQHATQCVVDSAWIVEDCVDLNNDNHCDVCGHQMYIEVRSAADLYTDRGFGISNGYYKLMNDVALTKPQYGNVYLNSDVVIDLNGYTLSNYPLNSPADAQFRSFGTANTTFVFTLKDSSEAKTGQFMSRFGDHFLYGGQNNGNNKLIINCEDGVTINTSYDYQGNEMNSFPDGGGYFVHNVSKDIEIRNAHLIIGNIAHVNFGYTVTFKNCIIETRVSNDYSLHSGTGSVVYDACTITTKGGSANALDSSSPSVTFTNGTTVNGVTK